MPYKSLDWVIPFVRDAHEKMSTEIDIGDLVIHRSSGKTATILSKKTDRDGWIKVQVKFEDPERDLFEVMPWGRASHSIGEFMPVNQDSPEVKT